MPSPFLDIPENRQNRSKLFRGVARLFEEDGVLQRNVRTILSWKGEDPELDVALPHENLCPWMRLTPFPESQDLEAVDLERAPVNIVVEMAILGTRADQLMDLWECIEHAMEWEKTSPDGDSVNLYLKRLRCYEKRVLVPSYGFMRGTNPNVLMLYGKGVIQFMLDIQR